MSDNAKSNSIIANKSYAFALEVISYKILIADKKEFVLSKQILRSGTSIGANVHEAISSESKKDFVHKLSILKEGKETGYWLNLLRDAEYITAEHYDILNGKYLELTKILSSIILTMKEKYLSKTTLIS